MKDLKLISLLFLLCLGLAFYARLQGFIPIQTGVKTDTERTVLGAQTNVPSFAGIIKNNR